MEPAVFHGSVHSIYRFLSRSALSIKKNVILISIFAILVVSVTILNTNLINDFKQMNKVSPSVYQITRKELIDRVCRENGFNQVSAMFVRPENRYLPIPYLNQTSPMLDEKSDEIPNTSHYHLISSYRTMGCFVNKVASTSFTTAFLKIQGITPPLQDDMDQTLKLSHLLLPKVLPGSAYNLVVQSIGYKSLS